MLICLLKTWTLRAETNPKAHLAKPTCFLEGENKTFIAVSDFSEETSVASGSQA